MESSATLRHVLLDVGSNCLWGARSDTAAELIPVVFLHGMTFDHRGWTRELEELSGRRQVAAFDLAGFGMSSLPTGSAVSYVENLHALLTAMGIGRAVLVGLSLGANIGMAYARAHPDKVAGLLLASPGLPGYRWRDERPPEIAAALARSDGLEAAKAYWLGHDMFSSLAEHPDAALCVASMVRDYSGSHWLQPGAVTPLPSMVDQLDKLEMPVLVVNGAGDLAEYRHIGRLIADIAPNARRIEFANAGHVVNLEAPDDFRSALEQFLDFIDHAEPDATLAPPIMFDLASPGTFVYSGMDSSRGERLNAFALSLRDPGCRRSFLSDETGYMDGFGLSPDEVAQVLARDWTGLLKNGGHLQAILKLAATVGQSLWDVGAHNAGIEAATLISICPRRVSSKMPFAGKVG